MQVEGLLSRSTKMQYRSTKMQYKKQYAYKMQVEGLLSRSTKMQYSSTKMQYKKQYQNGSCPTLCYSWQIVRKAVSGGSMLLTNRNEYLFY